MWCGRGLWPITPPPKAAAAADPGWKLALGLLPARVPAGPSRYGVRNAVSAASSSLGASSGTKWPQPGMTRVCTLVAASIIASPTPYRRFPLRRSPGPAGQLRGRALLVLRRDRVPRPVEPEAAAQGREAVGQIVDVDPDGGAGQLLERLDVEDEAKEDVFPPVDELVVHRGEPVEHEVEQHLVDRPGN